jgi:hypothetical protein
VRATGARVASDDKALLDKAAKPAAKAAKGAPVAPVAPVTPVAAPAVAPAVADAPKAAPASGAVPAVSPLPVGRPTKAEIAERAAAMARAKLAAKEKGGKGKKDRLIGAKDAPVIDPETRRLRLKSLIVLGKERGYLTYAEINDHLPDDMLDAEQIENVISMINDMGISVFDEAPDDESLLINEAAPAAADEDGAVFDRSDMGAASMGAASEDPYEQAVAVVLRDKKASTSYIQRRLQIGYNRAASIMERMENEGIVGPANHAGKREILVETQDMRDDD